MLFPLSMLVYLWPTIKGIKLEFLKVARDSPSDDEVVVVELLVRNGQMVRAGFPVADLEGAKSSYQLVSEYEGIISWYVQAGDTLRIGQVAAALLLKDETAPDIPPEVEDEPSDQSVDQGSDLHRFSKNAKRFLMERGLNPAEVLPHLGYVTLSDLENDVSAGEVGDLRLLPKGPLRIGLFGGGRGAEVAREIMGSQPQFAVAGVFDDGSNALESFSVPRVGSLDELSIASIFGAGGFDSALVTITSNMAKRKELLQLTERLGIPLITLIDRGALVSGSATIGEGTVAVSGSRIGASAVLEKNVFLSAFVNIEHHCVIGENTTFGPGVFLSGGVSVGRNSVFGTNIAVEPGVIIGEDCVIASGSVITQNVPPKTVVKSQSQLRLREIQ